MRGRDRDLPHTTLCLSTLCFRFKFLKFWGQLREKVPSLSLWAAGVWSLQSPPDWLTVEDMLTIPLRNPPAVLREVEKSQFFGGSVPSYSPAPWPAHTDGPKVEPLVHYGQDKHNTNGGPQDCEQCGKEIAKKLRDLGVGQPGRCCLYLWYC